MKWWGSKDRSSRSSGSPPSSPDGQGSIADRFSKTTSRSPRHSSGSDSSQSLPPSTPPRTPTKTRTPLDSPALSASDGTHLSDVFLNDQQPLDVETSLEAKTLKPFNPRADGEKVDFKSALLDYTCPLGIRWIIKPTVNRNGAPATVWAGRTLLSDHILQPLAQGQNHEGALVLLRFPDGSEVVATATRFLEGQQPLSHQFIEGEVSSTQAKAALHKPKNLAAIALQNVLVANLDNPGKNTLRNVDNMLSNPDSDMGFSGPWPQDFRPEAVQREMEEVQEPLEDPTWHLFKVKTDRTKALLQARFNALGAQFKKRLSKFDSEQLAPEQKIAFNEAAEKYKSLQNWSGQDLQDFLNDEALKPLTNKCAEVADVLFLSQEDLAMIDFYNFFESAAFDELSSEHKIGFADGVASYVTNITELDRLLFSKLKRNCIYILFNMMQSPDYAHLSDSEKTDFIRKVLGEEITCLNIYDLLEVLEFYPSAAGTINEAMAVYLPDEVDALRRAKAHPENDYRILKAQIKDFEERVATLSGKVRQLATVNAEDILKEADCKALCSDFKSGVRDAIRDVHERVKEAHNVYAMAKVDRHVQGQGDIQDMAINGLVALGSLLPYFVSLLKMTEHFDQSSEAYRGLLSRAKELADMTLTFDPEAKERRTLENEVLAKFDLQLGADVAAEAGDEETVKECMQFLTDVSHLIQAAQADRLCQAAGVVEGNIHGLATNALFLESKRISLQETQQRHELNYQEDKVKEAQRNYAEAQKDSECLSKEDAAKYVAEAKEILDREQQKLDELRPKLNLLVEEVPKVEPAEKRVASIYTALGDLAPGAAEEVLAALQQMRVGRPRHHGTSPHSSTSGSPPASPDKPPRTPDSDSSSRETAAIVSAPELGDGQHVLYTRRCWDQQGDAGTEASKEAEHRPPAGVPRPRGTAY